MLAKIQTSSKIQDPKTHVQGLCKPMQHSLKAIIQPAHLPRVASWLAIVVAIFGDNMGQTRDGASKASWLNKTL